MSLEQRPAGGGPRAYGAVLALALGAFCYVAMETLPIGLLQLIADDLGISQSRTGLLVTGYGLTVAAVSVPLAYATRRVPRRRLLVALLGVLVLATLAAAGTYSYPLLFITRLVVALTQALFWAVVAPAAAGLFPQRVRGRVMSVVLSGASLGPMLGVPAGTWIGQQAGWRASFLALAALELVAFLAVGVLMPAVPPGGGHAAAGSAPDSRRYAVVVATTALAVAGMFTLFTYTAVFLTEVSGFAPAALGPLLLVRGVADFAGIGAGGMLSDRHQRMAVAGPVALLAVSLCGMYALARVPLAVIAMLALMGFAMGAMAPAIQNRVLEVAPGSCDVASAGNSAAWNVGVAAGSLLGGLVLAGSGARGTALAGAVLATGALVVFLAEPLIASQPGRRQGRAGAAPVLGGRRGETPGGAGAGIHGDG